MNSTEIFQQIVSMYPKIISLREAKLHKNGGATIPELISAHDKIAEKNISISQEYEAMDWAIFQTLHKTATTLLAEDNWELNPAQISYKDVKSSYNDNIYSIKEQRT